MRINCLFKGKIMKRILSTLILVAISAGTALSADQTGQRFLFFTLMEKQGKISVLNAKVVSGKLHGRFPEQNGSVICKMLGTDSSTISSATITPPPLNADFPDPKDPTHLAGGLVKQDSTVFILRLPYTEAMKSAKFFKNPPANSPLPAIQGEQIGSCNLNEVLK